MVRRAPGVFTAHVCINIELRRGVEFHRTERLVAADQRQGAFGRAVVSGKPAVPYRPIPSPPRKWMPTSTCLPRGARAFAPMPPPMLELLNAPEVGLVEPVSTHGLAGMATVGNGVVPSPANGYSNGPPFAPKHGYTRSRNVPTTPNTS